MENNFSNRKRGFTIVEILIILAIMGALAVVVKMTVTASLTTAQDVRRVTDIQAIAGAMEQEKGFLESEYPTYATMPTYIGTTMLTVPSNNHENEGYYEWFDNTVNNSVFCLWATLSDEDALSQKKYFVANHFGTGYFESEPESLYNCGFYIDDSEGNPWHNPDDTEEEDPPIPDPNDKVYVCHLNGRGRGKTMLLPQAAVNAHLNHGDYLGECD